MLKFGDIKVSPVKNAVMFSVNSTFLAIKPHSKYLSLEFASKINHDKFPIEKTIQISKKRFAHFLNID